MIALIQRVSFASVVVDDQIVGEIGPGLLALVGVEARDSSQDVTWLAKRLLHYRMFSDDAGKMNLNVQQVSGECLLVPQFTLAADTNSGLRPSFTPAAAPDIGEQKFNDLVLQIKAAYNHVATGQFGADMQVQLCNDGPVTFWLQSPC